MIKDYLRNIIRESLEGMHKIYGNFKTEKEAIDAIDTIKNRIGIEPTSIRGRSIVYTYTSEEEGVQLKDKIELNGGKAILGQYDYDKPRKKAIEAQDEMNRLVSAGLGVNETEVIVKEAFKGL